MAPLSVEYLNPAGRRWNRMAFKSSTEAQVSLRRSLKSVLPLVVKAPEETEMVPVPVVILI